MSRAEKNIISNTFYEHFLNSIFFDSHGKECLPMYSLSIYQKELKYLQKKMHCKMFVRQILDRITDENKSTQIKQMASNSN